MFKKYAQFIVNSIVIVLILFLYAAIQIGEFSFFKQSAINQAENDVKLTSMDINSNISSYVNDQIMMSRLLSSDRFLREWIKEETGETTGPKAYDLYNYLSEYQHQYGYSCVFFVSEATKNFYYDKGFFKTLDENDPYDSWYRGFLGSLLNHDVQVDTDQLNEDKVSVFVNCIVQDQGYNTLGVVGVCKSIDTYMGFLTDYEKEYNVKVCFVDISPVNNSYNGSYKYYAKPDAAAKMMNLTVDQVTEKVDAGKTKTFFNGNICTCITYNSALGWNIIVQRDIGPMISDILRHSYHRALIVLFFTIVYVIMTITLFARVSKMSRENENVDELTGLYNNKIFAEMFNKKLKKAEGKGAVPTLFMVDIDDFKIFNDSYGHLYGNNIIKIVAEGLREMVNDRGLVAGWGGDEFIGVLRGSEDETKAALEDLMKELAKADTHRSVTLSCGIVKVNPHLSLENNMNLADRALYVSKSNGKGRCTLFEEVDIQDNNDI